MTTLDLRYFTGTEGYFRISRLTKVVLTDGTLYVAKETNNVGLMQDIGIDLDGRRKVAPYLRKENFVLVKIDTEGFGLRYEDGNGNKLGGYPLTGYPILKIDLYAGMLDETIPVLYLPSER